ncbi:hypothetical protein ACH5RR_025833 [Cinchona calisaya]|uniref:Uncharacterized protein n=1 Tax=Cinchona calisaya TaxID=153742 RepID=A0ABD2Z2P9_9GENT
MEGGGGGNSGSDLVDLGAGLMDLVGRESGKEGVGVGNGGRGGETGDGMLVGLGKEEGVNRVVLRVVVGRKGDKGGGRVGVGRNGGSGGDRQETGVEVVVDLSLQGEVEMSGRK